jgi:carbamoyl-phosphate synthase large subunit
MPKRTDINTILILGAGPILIGQGCEFDYAGSQACFALKSCGYRVILVNPNPATIMTDPNLSDATYIEPLTLNFVEKIIQKERPDAILPTVGGQVALNLAIELEKSGILDKYGIQLIGASVDAIERAENRQFFHEIVEQLGLDIPKSYTVRDKKAAIKSAQKIGYPIMVRPSFILGGNGTGIAKNEIELLELFDSAKSIGLFQELTLEESLYGWKEYELEVVRDYQDNCIVVCSIENIDPLGVHTGDSITVSPIQTLTDKEYQKMRDASFDILRAVGVETGGSNVQFAVNPVDGRMVVIEMNPRVSRSSALASKVTGFPIAKVAAQLSVGYTLNELSSDIISSQIPASFEPVIDYVVVKMPCFQFEKFPEYPDVLSTKMQSVGESMAIGRTFTEALLKCMRSIGVQCNEKFSKSLLLVPNSKRMWYIFCAFRKGLSVQEVHDLTQIDHWFLNEIYACVMEEKRISYTSKSIVSMKRIGYSDLQIGEMLDLSEGEVRAARDMWNIKPVFKRVDGCSAEFETSTAYLYSTYEKICESKPIKSKKVIVIGSGPNMIGQGIEFDYSCVHAAKALQALGFEVIMINSNPETVSTDYDVSDRLYCSPLTFEDISSVIELENPVGIFLQFGGQIPLNLAGKFDQKIPLLGMNANAVDICENRDQFNDLLDELQVKYPQNLVLSMGESAPTKLDYPIIVRPSYVLGGRSMKVVNNKSELKAHLESLENEILRAPILLEKFLENALEVEVDAISDGENVFIPALVEQIEQAGVHSGDSTCYIPTRKLSEDLQEEITSITTKIALKLGVKGFLNLQFAVYKGTAYVLEANPRCSRTVPFLSKSLGIDLVELAVRCIMGFPLSKNLLKGAIESEYYFVKEPVFSSSRFKVSQLGPEMKSTGEVMGVSKSFSEACNKAKIAAGNKTGDLTELGEVVSLQEIFNTVK